MLGTTYTLASRLPSKLNNGVLYADRQTPRYHHSCKSSYSVLLAFPVYCIISNEMLQGELPDIGLPVASNYIEYSYLYPALRVTKCCKSSYSVLLAFPVYYIISNGMLQVELPDIGLPIASNYIEYSYLYPALRVTKCCKSSFSVLNFLSHRPRSGSVLRLSLSDRLRIAK